MPYSRITERLGLVAGALGYVATAQASQAVASGGVGTTLTSNTIDTLTSNNQRYLVKAGFVPISTAATGAATVAIYHGTHASAMSAASVGTGTTPMQATASVTSAGKIVTIELNESDLIGKNRYIQAVVTPGGALAAAVTVTVQAEADVRPVASPTVAVTAAAVPVIIADL